MKKLLLYTAMSVTWLLFPACNSCNSEEKRYEIMKRYGGWEARADEIRSKAESIRTSLSDLLHYEFDSLSREAFDSESPYWQEIHIYLGKDGISHARLQPDPEKARTIEEFYFDKGELIFAAIYEQGEQTHTKKIKAGMSGENIDSTAFQGKNQYFFVQNRMVLALDPQGVRKDISDKKVLIRGVDLLSEARQIKQIIADKKIKL